MNIMEQAKLIKKSWGKGDFSEALDAILDLPVASVPDWTVGESYKKGQIVQKDSVKYLIMNNVTAQAHQPPDMANGVMLSVYKPYRDAGRYTWIYGEYCLKGYERSENGKWYKAIQDPNANIYPPSQVPAVWSVVNE